MPDWPKYLEYLACVWWGCLSYSKLLWRSFNLKTLNKLHKNKIKNKLSFDCFVLAFWEYGTLKIGDHRAFPVPKIVIL